MIENQTIERLSIQTEYRKNENKAYLCFRQNNPPTTTVAKMNPKKAKETCFHIGLSEVVILGVVVGVAKKLKHVNEHVNALKELSFIFAISFLVNNKSFVLPIQRVFTKNDIANIKLNSF